MTAVEEFLTASRRGPPANPMAATSCLRPAPVATESMVAVALGTAGVRVVLAFWAVVAPSIKIRLQMIGGIKRGLGSVMAMMYVCFNRRVAWGDGFKIIANIFYHGNSMMSRLD